ncbi:MAG: glycosyltransferase [Rhodomicrobiaceae bacterium]
MNDRPTIQVTFPVLNEEAQLEASVEKTLAFCAAHGLTIAEFCIADNGSTDRTPEIGEALAARHDNVTYLRVGKRGFGLALKHAWGQSDADFVGYMDLDLATDLKHLAEVHAHVMSGAPYDFYLGSRLKPGATVRKRSLLRAMTSRAFNALLRARLGVGFSDAMCGFKFIRRGLYEEMAGRFTFSDDWFFVAQLAVRGEWLSARMLDMPVEWTDDPNSASGARLFNLSRLYLEGISELKQEMRRLDTQPPVTAQS